MNTTELYDKISKGKFLISGPCIIEGQDMLLKTAEKVSEMANKLGFTYIFKASFDKANRTSLNAFRGPGLEEGLKMLQKVKDEFGLAICTDIHEVHQAEPVSEVADILQIPAFLCRQTDLLVASAKTGNIINIKKGQFLSGKDMQYPAQKVIDSGNHKVLLTERGNMFGYGDLVVDFRNLVDMKALGFPVVMDVTHSTQKPGGLAGKSGGNREYAPYLAKAAAAVGVNGFFFEVHENPEIAKSDGPNMIPISEFENLLKHL